MLADHLPPEVALVIATGPMESQRLGDIEEAFIATAVEKRQREFRSGRNAAKAALAQLGLKGEISLPPDTDGRRPSWPTGYVGSITHTHGFCAAAVARARDYAAVAIDVEPRTPMRRGVAARICTERELKWILERSDDYLHTDLEKAIFCIKETLYKVFNPLYGVYLGFQEAEVRLNLDEGSFTAKIHQRKAGIRCRYSGRLSLDDDYLYATTVVKNTCG